MIPLTNDIIELSVYADYLEDQGRYIEALHLREELQEVPDDGGSWCWCCPNHWGVGESYENWVGGKWGSSGVGWNCEIGIGDGNVNDIGLIFIARGSSVGI